jgi:hypothetical protein
MPGSRKTVRDEPSSRPLLDKLGVREGLRVSALGIADEAFVRSLRDRGADVSTRRRPHTDLVFLGATRLADVARLEPLEPFLEREAAVWVVYPRGRPEIRETDVIGAGVACGFVDNKVVRFSDTHTALRFVIPRARR